MAVTTRKWISKAGMSLYVREGVGTTVAIESWSWSVYDDFRSGLKATYLADDGEWVTVSWEYQGRATIDADEATMALWKTKLAEDARKARDAKAEAYAAEEARKLASTYAGYPERGDWIKVVRGRKVPKGTEGRVFWIGDGRYGARIGFNGEGGETYWTALSNVEKVVIPAEKKRREIDAAAAFARAEYAAARRKEREAA